MKDTDVQWFRTIIYVSSRKNRIPGTMMYFICHYLLLLQLLFLCSVAVSGFRLQQNNRNEQFLHLQNQNLRCLTSVLLNNRFSTTSLLKASTITSDDEASGSALDMKQTVPDMEAYASAYKTVFQELPYKECTPSMGNVPSDLFGSYFRCGPAMFSAGSIVPPKTSIVQPKQPPVPDGTDPDRMVLHPFEGDGAILGVTFTNDNKIVVRYRFIRTAALTKERKKGLRLYTAMDTTRKMGSAVGAGVGNDFPLPLFRHHLQPGLNKSRKNTSNTRAIYWGKRLFTLFEGCQPYKLDARALSTDGRSRLGGAIRRDSDPFGTKLSYDAETNRALFYSVDQNGINTDLTLYEFDSDFKLIKDESTGNGRTSHDLPGYALINDFCITKSYALFVQPHVNVNAMQFLVNKEPGKTLTVDSNTASVLHVIPRIGTNAKKLSFSIPLDGPYEANIHFCNAYEIDNTIVIDAILSDGSTLMKSPQARPVQWPWGRTIQEFQSAASKKSLWRYKIEITTGSISKELLYNNQCYFGTINPTVSAKEHRYIYMNTGGLGPDVAPPQGIVKFDCKSKTLNQEWKPESYEFCGEPIYASRSTPSTSITMNNIDEDDGYILSVLNNGRTKESELLIFEATNIRDGPITRIPLGIGIPHGYFGCFTTDTEQVIGSNSEEIDRRVKLMDKMESRGNRWNEVKSDFSGLGLRLDDMEEYFGDWNPFD